MLFQTVNYAARSKYPMSCQMSVEYSLAIWTNSGALRRPLRASFKKVEVRTTRRWRMFAQPGTVQHFYCYLCPFFPKVTVCEFIPLSVDLCCGARLSWICRSWLTWDKLQLSAASSVLLHSEAKRWPLAGGLASVIVVKINWQTWLSKKKATHQTCFHARRLNKLSFYSTSLI